MSVLSIPNTFVTGATINAAPFNGNFNAVATAVNSIDNTNIGAAGLFASNLKPTTGAQGTFAGTVGYTFLAASTSSVPVTISGITSQSADLLDVTLTNGGTKAFSIASGGTTTVLGLISQTGVNVGGALTGATTGAFSSIITAPEVIAGSGTLSLSGAASGANGVFFNYNTAATNGVSVFDGGSTNYIQLMAGASKATVTTNSNNPVAFSQTIEAASGTLVISGAPSGADGVFVNYNTAATSGIAVYDGGTTHFVQLTAGASNATVTTDSAHPVAFSQSISTTGSLTAGSSVYGPTSATVAGTLLATQKIAAGSATYASAATVNGDLAASRSVSSGALNLGGSTTNAFLDFGVTTASVFTLTTGYPLNVNGGYVTPVYNASGAALAGTTHTVIGQTTIAGNGATATITLSGSAVFASSASYAVNVTETDNSPSGNFTVNIVSGTSFTITNATGNSNRTYSWTATGA